MGINYEPELPLLWISWENIVKPDRMEFESVAPELHSEPKS